MLYSGFLLPEFVGNTIAPLGKFPLYIEERTTYPARATFQASFVRNSDPVAFCPVDHRWAKVQTGLILALFFAGFVIQYLEMTFFVHLEPVQE
jgi:hypothetical protein